MDSHTLADIAKCGKIRVFLSGCWDLPHSGHFNAFRQVRECCAKFVDGDDSRVVLVVGVHSNDEIRREKGGAFVMSEDEKDVVLRSCRFVDEIVHDIPYDEMSPTVLDRADIRCHVASHGDDPVMLKKGVGMYAASQAAGRFCEFPRTQGISTTHLIDRLLMIGSKEELPLAFESCALTAGLVASFQRPRLPCRAGARVGYVDGDWDLLHAGHIRVLEEVRRRCDYLIVGVHSSEDVRGYHSSGRPVMSSGERLLLVLACRHVDDAVLDAPVRPSQQFLLALRVDIVFRVMGHPDFVSDSWEGLAGRYRAAEGLGIVSNWEVPEGLLTTGALHDRVANSLSAMQERQVKKRPKGDVQSLPPSPQRCN